MKELKYKLILEVGCGAGRFTELLVNSGALVHAIDMSDAVDANKINIGQKQNYKIAQADIRTIPYKNFSFDYVICLGVLQHTPKPVETVKLLWEKVANGGTLIIDNYPLNLRSILKCTHLYRQVLKRLPPFKAKKITDFLVKIIFPLHWHIRKLPFAQALLSRFSPVYFHFLSYPNLKKEEYYELARLDTFDALTDKYKYLKTKKMIKKILEDLENSTDIHVVYVSRQSNGIEGRTRKLKEV